MTSVKHLLNPSDADDADDDAFPHVRAGIGWDEYAFSDQYVFQRCELARKLSRP
jgi:hypothetical protein